VSRIESGFFSLTSTPPEGDEAEYLRWHLLDHLPEQYALPGIRLGTRWRADEGCVARRLAVSDDLAPVRHVMSYLITDPVEGTLREFARLGGRLRDEGRYPQPATPHLLGAYELTGTWAAPSALVSPEVVPFRAHRGVYLVLERPPADGGVARHWREWHDTEHVPALLAIDGVAGVCTFATSDRLGTHATQGRRFDLPAWDPRGLEVSVIYLDGDVGATAERLAPRIEDRWRGPDVIPELAGPFRSTVTYEAWPGDP
jgi:hypothetical protein